MADFRRKFTDAARRYIHLSYDPAIHPEEKQFLLKCAMICAILSQVIKIGNSSWGWFHIPLKTLGILKFSPTFVTKLMYAHTLQAGQQRSKQLAALYKDERCQQLPAFSLLEKMYLDRIIRPVEMEEFAALLAPHHKVTWGNFDEVPIYAFCCFIFVH